MSLIETLGLYIRKISQRIFYKLREIKGSPKSVADGFVTGIAVSFTPFVGFHILIALLIAKTMKQSGLAATLGTIAGNPWTFPVIWYLIWHTGMLFLLKDMPAEPIHFSLFFKELFHALIMLDFKTFLSDIWPVFFPMLIGCIPFCAAIWALMPQFIIRMLNKKSVGGNKNNDTGNRL